MNSTIWIVVDEDGEFLGPFPSEDEALNWAEEDDGLDKTQVIPVREPSPRL